MSQVVFLRNASGVIVGSDTLVYSYPISGQFPPTVPKIFVYGDLIAAGTGPALITLMLAQIAIEVAQGTAQPHEAEPWLLQTYIAEAAKVDVPVLQSSSWGPHLLLYDTVSASLRHYESDPGDKTRLIEQPPLNPDCFAIGPDPIGAQMTYGGLLLCSGAGSGGLQSIETAVRQELAKTAANHPDVVGPPFVWVTHASGTTTVAGDAAASTISAKLVTETHSILDWVRLGSHA